MSPGPDDTLLGRACPDCGAAPGEPCRVDPFAWMPDDFPFVSEVTLAKAAAVLSDHPADAEVTVPRDVLAGLLRVASYGRQP